MKRTLIAGAVVFAALLALGTSSTFADIGVVLEVTNRTTGEMGTNISASTGDIVEIRLEVTNTGVDQDVEVNVVGGVVGCMVDVTAVKKIKSGKTRKRKVQGRVPSGDHGTFTVDVTAVGAVDGAEGGASASVALGNPKATEAPTSRGGVLRRVFVNMLASALLDGLNSDPVAETFAHVKQLYR